MKITKAGAASAERQPESGELGLVNIFAKKELAPEDVYIFSVLLCDNEVDRDFERFSEGTLKELGELFVGATGICDHEWKSANQIARIYRTELLRDSGRKNSLGMPYMYLKGWAYMLRTPQTESVITQIEGGIKKETSVGCSVAKSLCSICGKELGSSGCSHVKGREYGGRLCYGELSGAVDAYEWSFVAVPAQKGAGVIKKLAKANTLKGFVESGDGADFSAEFEELEKAAALGRKYIKALRDEVLRKSLVCDKAWYEALSKTADKMDEAALLSLKGAFDGKIAKKMPVTTQLMGKNTVTAFDGSQYKI